MSYIVELEPHVWIAPVEGDPGRTLQIDNATRFRTIRDARHALRLAKKFRPGAFKNASVSPAPSPSAARPRAVRAGRAPAAYCHER